MYCETSQWFFYSSSTSSQHNDHHLVLTDLTPQVLLLLVLLFPPDGDVLHHLQHDPLRLAQREHCQPAHILLKIQGGRVMYSTSKILKCFVVIYVIKVLYKTKEIVTKIRSITECKDKTIWFSHLNYIKIGFCQLNSTCPTDF